ncbi:IclR family transcriptional regulator [Ovoidimarina sediminis]|uniref:IclR family transcriptional regulator n=1 Tax=Ovoidimarina sediminis TaxID=3079856 RepID=UPI002915A430|nr:IclR family transcriptional regulator [Rhodophyticola sp. MJ-SS7]MDU8944725.1 IclR family transcriptional regulator [Rhodophyticola sp. MJ-SS7]
MNASDTSHIPTTLRLLLVIEELAKAGRPLTPTEVNTELNLPKPTIHRLFATLEEEGFLQRDLGGRTFAPATRLRRIAGGILSSEDMRLAQRTILLGLSREIGETCNIAVPDGDAMRYVDRVETEWPLRIQLPVGTRVPLYATASGKMYLSSIRKAQAERFFNAVALEAHTPRTVTDASELLAELKLIRRQGYALDTEEFMEDMIALAVPVLGAGERLLATLSLHAPSQRFGIDQAIGALPRIKKAAADLSGLING